MTYNVEFTATITVEAEDEDNAVDLAVAELADDNGNVALSDFYIYVDGNLIN